MKIHRFTLLTTLLTGSAFAQIYTNPSSGDVGIGWSNPNAKLTVFAGTLGTTAGSFLDLSNQSTFTGNHTQLITRLVRTAEGDGWEKAAIQLLRRTDVTDQAYISLYRDNVGIGAITPAAKLHVQGNPASGPGNEALWIDNNGVPFVTRREAAGGGTVEVGTPYFHNMSLIANGSPVIFLGASGNVGIGTTAPTGKLDVSGIPDGASVFFRSTGRPFLNIKGGANSYKSLRFSNVENDGDFRWDLNVFPGDHPTNPDGFGWWNPSNGQVFTMKTNGNVGIGTTNPAHKLAVNGTIKAKEVIVETTGWSDYVFADDYRLAPLAEVEAHIKTNNTSPAFPPPRKSPNTASTSATSSPPSSPRSRNSPSTSSPNKSCSARSRTRCRRSSAKTPRSRHSYVRSRNVEGRPVHAIRRTQKPAGFRHPCRASPRVRPLCVESRRTDAGSRDRPSSQSSKRLDTRSSPTLGRRSPPTLRSVAGEAEEAA